MTITEQQVTDAPHVMSEMIAQAIAKHRAWQAQYEGSFSNDLWSEKFQEFMDEAFAEFEHGFESREHLSEAHRISTDRMEATIRRRLQ